MRLPRLVPRVGLLIALAAVPFGLWALLPVASSGSSTAGLQRQIDRKEAKIRVARGHEQVLTSDITAYTRRIGALQRDIGALQVKQVRLESNLTVKRAELARVQARLRAEELRLARLRARLAQARAALANRLVQLYKADKPDVVTVVLESDGFQQLLERTQFLHRISQQDTSIIEAVRTAKAQAAAAAARLGALERHEAQVAAVIQSERDQVVAVKGQLVVRRDSYASERSQKAALLARTRSHRHALEDDVAGLRSQQEAIRARLAAAARAAVARSAAVSAPGPVHAGSGGLIWPVNGPITSPFCEARAWESCHPGIDIGVPSGTPVRAAAAGQVVLEQSEAASGGYGNFLCIQHTGSLSTCYAHLMRFTVSMGQSVSQGQVVAISDCTGRCYGPHLHFETRVNGSVVNPMNYL